VPGPSARPARSGSGGAAEGVRAGRPGIRRRLAVVLVLLLATGFGVVSLQAQHHFAAQRTGGAQLSLPADILADGSSARTAWPGWLASMFFLLALLRLQRGPPEPPAGLSPAERLTASQIRAGLRREYLAVRVALVVVAVLATLDTGRAAVYAVAAAAGSGDARGTVVATVVEAVGLCTATVILGRWLAVFRAQLRRLGALDEPLRQSPPG